LNYTTAALLIGSVLLMIAMTLTVSAPTYVPIAKVDLSLVEASLRHVALNALVAYVNKKASSVEVALSQNLDALDKRLVPWSSYAVLSYSPSTPSGYWPEASLSVKYTIDVGGRAVDYACYVRLRASLISTTTDGMYFVVTVKFYDENGVITNPNLFFNPKPVKMVVEGDALKLYYLQRPSAIEVIDERGLKAYLTP